MEQVHITPLEMYKPIYYIDCANCGFYKVVRDNSLFI